MREFEKTFEQHYGREMTDAEQHVSRQLERSFSRDWRLFPSRLYAWPPETHPVFVLVFALVTTAYSDTVRHYFIQAQDSVWDFAPAARIWSTAVRFLIPGTHSHTLGKVRYSEYTDASFSNPKPQPEWLGILGPIIRA